MFLLFFWLKLLVENHVLVFCTLLDDCFWPCVETLSQLCCSESTLRFGRVFALLSTYFVARVIFLGGTDTCVITTFSAHILTGVPLSGGKAVFSTLDSLATIVCLSSFKSLLNGRLSLCLFWGVLEDGNPE